MATNLNEAIAQLAEQLQQMQILTRAAADTSHGGSRQNASQSGGSFGTTLLDIFGGGLGLSPLISGIVSLLGGGGDNPSPPPLVRFALPPAIQATAGFNEGGGQPFAVDYPQGGSPRPVPTPAPAQITVQVQAMDSRSFLDHRSDIAMAVRQAMLESSVLNDVVREA